MKIFIIMTILGHIHLIIGPMPYSFEECTTRKVLFEKSWLKDFDNLSSSDPYLIYDGSRVTRGDVKMYCVQKDTAPIIGSEYIEDNK